MSDIRSVRPPDDRPPPALEPHNQTAGATYPAAAYHTADLAEVVRRPPPLPREGP